MNASSAEVQDGNSDYGSDFTPEEEDILNRILLQSSPSPNFYPVLDLLPADIVDNENTHAARLHYNPRNGSQERSWHCSQRPIESKSRIPITIDSHSSSSSIVRKFEETPLNASAEQVKGPGPKLQTPAERPDPEPGAQDLRSPLERFRTKPKKPLSVSDLVAPAWCELQYWYTLTTGRRKRTPAMKQGTKVHQRLEAQVHRVVPVDVMSREDGWGLTVWNIIQGLRTLRLTGMTRELQVMGIIDGQVVTGVIDELSYNCPDRGLEETRDHTAIDQNLPAGQTSITDFLKQQPGSLGEFSNIRVTNKTARIYLTDVKTRSSKFLPQGPSFRPTVMQLMLYHQLLSNLADQRTDSAVFFDRFGLQPNLPFSDALIAQIAAINDESFQSVPSTSTEITQDVCEVLLSHNSLHLLWTLMMDEIALTMPRGAASIGRVLNVEYRAPSDGSVIANKTFLHDNDVLQPYLEDGMSWWKGEREARGVCIEEAYKCGFCDFAEGCDWRKNKSEEALRSRTTSVF
ncbi:hypothetical protein MMC07_005590 [Pseudocyphellaria aurata]|nr:hypothetical protein [Pseudocyphellaria aurata]